MKKTFQISSFLLLVFMTVAAYSQAPPTKVITVPTEYNDYIVGQQNMIGEGILNFVSVFSDTASTSADAKAKLNLVLQTTSDVIDNMNNLQTYTPDFGLKESAINLFTFYKRIIGTTYFAIVDEVYSTTPDTAKLDEMLKAITEEEAGLDKAYQESQQKFAAENKFTLEDNKLEEKFK